ncbi:phage holin family protein [Candidatus Gottesmanbacteria bacterium]|nr:phage holin family protein [Candidatus Gottesmanbacteria bacterium]
MRLLAEWIIKAFILLITTRLVPGFTIDSWLTALVVALVLGILNTVLKPILVLLTLPATILTLGLFMFVINAVLLILTSKFVTGFQIESFGTAIIASIVISLLSLLVNMVFKSEEKNS